MPGVGNWPVLLLALLLAVARRPGGPHASGRQSTLSGEPPASRTLRAPS